jgi:hypothetical protein
MLVELSRAPSRDHQEVYVWRHPRLLESGVAEALAAAVAATPRRERRPLSRALGYLREVQQRYQEQPAGYPIGVGPIEAVWQQISNGQISAAEGERLVTAPAFTATLSSRYLRSLSGWITEEAIHGARRPAMQAIRLVHAAAQASDAAVATVEVQAWIAADWLEVAKLALHQAPDGGLLAEARSIGETALADVGQGGDWRIRSALLFGLGTLYLDPYFAYTSSARVEDRLDAWLRRGALDAGPADDEAVAEMPEPVQALHTAEGFLRQALALKPAGHRAATLKALGDVFLWRRQLDDEVDTAEIVGLTRDALAELGDSGDINVRVSLLDRLGYLGEQVDVSAAAPVLDRPPAELAEELGVESAISSIIAAVRVILPSAPRTALDALRRNRALLKTGTEDLRAAALECELTALADALAPRLAEGTSLADRIQELPALASREGWNGAARAAAMLSLANSSSTTDEEHLGLKLLGQIPEMSPIIAAEHAELIAFLRTNLELGMGVNAYRERQWAKCAQWYARALSGWLDLGFDDRGLETLFRVGDIVSQADTPVDAEFLMALAPNAARIETRLGDGATTVIQDLVQEAIAAMGGRPVSPDALHMLWQIAKGARLAPVLASGLRYDPARDQRSRRLLAMIDELRADLPTARGAAETDQAVLLDEETVLTAYARHQEVEGGATREEQLANLEHTYDEHLTRQLLVAVGDQSSAFLGLDEVQALLGDRTVLLSLYLGAAEDQIAVYVLYMTSEDVGMSVIPHGFPSSTLMIGELLTSPFAPLVGQARRYVQDPPLGRRLVSRDAEELLDSYLPGLLGHVSERLSEFKAAGRDHLCIVPHGPFHFFPFHLLGPAGWPLAQDFAVTYLPHLHLLAANRNRAANSLPGTAIGLGFAADDRPGLVPLSEAVPEAREIAAMFGTEAVAEEKATEQAVIAALQGSGVVHLATHGRHNVDAPAFQTLYLHPSRNSDGQLQAHELLGLDLRGMRLITLSACETALGRFDGGDNIRGLSASFFITGVSALIGTLWQVRDAVSHHFFAAFYHAYLGGTPLLDAFVSAQRLTRTQFPQYRDWGAFYFAGDWAERHDIQETSDDRD